MKTVIIVNSVQLFNEKEKGILNRAEFRILTTSSAREALRMHREERADLIVAELDMPEMGGDLLCSRIRAETELMRVSVILICHDRQEDLKRVTACGANAWVAKPLRSEQLVEKIEQLLAVSSRRGYRVLLSAKIRGATENASFFCVSHNISSSGILIETEMLLHKDDRVTCKFFLPGARQIMAEGIVARTVQMPDGEYRHGVSFIDLAPEFRHDIERFVAAQNG
jgi:DNA-binding response OmpR family regulator